MASEVIKGLYIDAATNEISEKPLTADEIALLETIKQEQIQVQAAIEAKATARASALAKLAELGLTEEEIQAL